MIQISVEKAILNTKIKILDPKTLKIVPPNVIGEIYVKSGSLMQGYVYENFYINSIDRNDYLKTGDLGYVDKDGDLFITGRVDDIVNVAGNNVNLNTVQSAIEKAGFFNHCAVFGVPDSHLITRIVCIFEANIVGSLTSKQIIQLCSKSLYTYELPKEFVVCENIPLSNNGKLSRYLLTQMYEHGELCYTTLPYES